MLIGSIFWFLIFFATALVALVAFIFMYEKVTPYDDYKLIYQEGNSAAAISFGGAIIGVSIPIFSALSHSVSYIDFLVWVIIAILVQLFFAFISTRVSKKYSFKEQIESGKVSVGLLMSAISLAIGILNAGSMSY